MSLRERPWFPWVSAALWGLVVFALVAVNTGNLVVAVALGVVVALISRKIDGSRQQ